MLEKSIWQKKWVVGNWKMNANWQENQTLLSQLGECVLPDKVCVGIAPPAVYLTQAQTALNQSIYLCAQDVSRFADRGAYTGEVCAQMMADVGAKMALVGHSERGLYFNENNDIRRQKMENVLKAGLIPILCVGESLQQREAGRELETVAHQLSILKGLPTNNFAIAYEPVWAIGTGQVATTAQIAQMHAFIGNEILTLCGDGVRIRILYGGSVNEKNAVEIFSVPKVDGALVGGASLKCASFTAIIHSAQETN